MKRKVAKIGPASLMVALPPKWIKQFGVQKGDEIELYEEDSRLIIDPAGGKKKPKSTSISLKRAPLNYYRSLFGGLYRGGYDEIRISFKDPAVIPIIQKTVDSLYGYEVFEVDDKSCTVKTIYNEEVTEIISHVNRMIHTIITMQSILMKDLAKKKYASEEEMKLFKSNIIKQRDIIARVIIRQKLFDEKRFPYYSISQSLWNIGRNYELLYRNLTDKEKYSETDTKFLKETNTFFVHSFGKGKEFLFDERYPAYKEIKERGLKLMHKQPSFIIGICINILLATQSADSFLLLLNGKSARH